MSVLDSQARIAQVHSVGMVGLRVLGSILGGRRRETEVFVRIQCKEKGGQPQLPALYTN